MTDPSMSTLALGTDLTTLGLNLTTTSASLHPTLLSVYSDIPSESTDPVYTTPSCYRIPHTLPHPLTKLKAVSEETLFYIFYAFPRDSLQEVAAQELHRRSWRYHKELKLWVCRDPNEEVVVKGENYERGVYVFFDPGTWQRVTKEWVLHYDLLEDRGAMGGAAARKTNGVDGDESESDGQADEGSANDEAERDGESSKAKSAEAGNGGDLSGLGQNSTNWNSATR
ncbi:hypothetical protein HDU97_006083 [Phlyctochytrium planicorne]|nr:hypothetical protein HDU97_006083 [Phlyctochytrium planicorne]